MATILSLNAEDTSDEVRPSLAKVIIGVSDMQRAVEFYRDSIGLEVESPSMEASYDDEQWVTFSAGQCTLALRRGSERDSSGGGPRIVITVADIDRARQRLSDRGLDVEAARSPAPGIWLIDVRDPDGNRLSLEAFSPAPWMRGDQEISFTVM